MQKKVLKIDLAASDKLEAEYNKLITMEKEMPSKVADLKNKIDDEFKKLMIVADSVIFEYQGLKEKIVALVGQDAAKSWDSINNGKENYADMVQKAIVNFRKQLDSIKYIG
jgi:hypothetical protein